MTLVSGDMTSGETTFGRLDRKALLCLSDNTKAVAGVLHVNGVFWATFYVFYQEPITAFMQIPTLYVLTLISFYFRHLQLVTLD